MTLKTPSLIALNAWMAAFLKARGLSQPDQRSLYAYQVTRGEYDALKRRLQQVAQLPGSENPAACGAFALFCAEWYRREYQQGWTWEPIEQTLGIALSAGALRQILPTAIEQFWQRPIRWYEERRNFLGTIFGEGGLPFQLLARADNKFFLVLETVLTRLIQTNANTQMAEKLTAAAVIRFNLPKAFHEFGSVELMASMAQQLVALVRQYELAEASDPAAHLDQQYPHWRHAFPLPLDDATGTELLNRLLQKASKEERPAQGRSTQLQCRHQLLTVSDATTSETDYYALRTHIQLPKRLTLVVSQRTSTPRLEIAVFERDQLRVNLGPHYATMTEDEQGHHLSCRLQKTQVSMRRHHPKSTLTLVVTVEGDTIHSQAIPDSTLGVGEIPLGFGLDNGDGWLIGQASFSTPYEDVLLLAPPMMDASRAISTTATSTLATSTVNKRVQASPEDILVETYSLQGQHAITLQDDADRYSIRTGHSAANTTAMIDGQSIEWLSQPDAVFLGQPSAQAGDTQVAGDVTLCLGQRSAASIPLNEAFGAQWWRVKNTAGDTLMRRKLGVLPRDFRIQLVSGTCANQGEICVTTQHNCSFKVDHPDVQVMRSKQGCETHLTLTAQGVPPSKITLEVTPNLLADPIRLQIPFPTRGALLLDKHGKLVKRALKLDALKGSRLWLMATRQPTDFYMEFRLQSKRSQGRRGQHAVFAFRHRVMDQPKVLNLYDFHHQITRLCAIEAGIDQVVVLFIFEGGTETQYHLQQHQSLFEQQADTQQWVRVGQPSELPTRPQLMLLTEPERAPLPLTAIETEEVATGAYELPNIVEKNGPWLIVPERGSAPFRPRFLPGQPIVDVDTPLDEIHTLHKASACFKHGELDNAFTRVLDVMAREPLHSGWDFLKALYERFGYLPLATFEVWKAVLNHPNALAMALFKFEMASDFIQRLDNEFPILWPMLPMAAIRCAADHWLAGVIKPGLPEAIAQAALNQYQQKLGEAVPYWDGNVTRYLQNKTLGQETQLSPALFSQVFIQKAHQGLLQRNAETSWPEWGGQKLEAWYQQYLQTTIPLPSQGLPHQKAVLYLPLFAAAVAQGQAQISDVFADNNEVRFFLQSAQEFDLEWFIPIYKYGLLNLFCPTKNTSFTL